MDIASYPQERCHAGGDVSPDIATFKNERAFVAFLDATIDEERPEPRSEAVDLCFGFAGQTEKVL